MPVLFTPTPQAWLYEGILSGAGPRVKEVGSAIAVFGSVIWLLNMAPPPDLSRTSVKPNLSATGITGAAGGIPAGSGVFLADRSGLCTYLNQCWQDIFGCTAGECLGNGWQRFIDPADRGRVTREWADSLRQGSDFIQQFRIRTAGGETRLVELRCWRALAHDGGFDGYIGTLENITERKRCEAEALQARRMESVGRLAGGLVHDFANLLTLISGYSEILLGRMRQSDPLRGQIEEIRSAANRGAGLTSQLLAFSRRQGIEPSILDLNESVAELEKMLCRMIGEHIELKTVLCSGLGKVKANAGQIEQVIMNLVLNARDAMARGGTITIRTANVDHPKPRVMLSITDTGHGIDSQTMAHIFEPFFTTKEHGKGTGLGLSTVDAIVKQCGGEIRVTSEPCKGATFTIFFPLAGSEAEERRPDLARGLPSVGTETILLVEDESGVRKLLHYVLVKKGYKVLEASDGNEALKLYREHGGKIDLLLTDVVMPRMSGRELAERLLMLQPDLKILYMSGYTTDVLIRSGALRPGITFLQKPLKPEALAVKIRETLDNAISASPASS